MKEFVVKKKAQGAFPLTFAPKWVQNAECKIILTNTYTNDIYEYHVKGFTEEPISEGHIVINCTTRESIVYEI